MIAKTRRLPEIVALGVMSLCLCCFAGAQAKTPAEKYEALLGTWDVQTENAAYTFVFEFFLKDDALKGKYTGSAGTTEMEKLTFENNILHFSVTVNGMALEYSAVIEEDKLSGQVSLEYGQADITGKKRKTEAAVTS